MAVCSRATAEECARKCECKTEVEAELGKEPAATPVTFDMALSQAQQYYRPALDTLADRPASA